MEADVRPPETVHDEIKKLSAYSARGYSKLRKADLVGLLRSHHANILKSTKEVA